MILFRGIWKPRGPGRTHDPRPRRPDGRSTSPIGPDRQVQTEGLTDHRGDLTSPERPALAAPAAPAAARGSSQGRHYRESLFWAVRSFESRTGHPVVAKRHHGWPLYYAMYNHSWRPSSSEKNFLPRNLAEPVADARLCCARAPAHRHVAPRRPGPALFTWQRRRCPKGSCIDTRGEGRWWVRSPANSRTRFSERQKSYRKIGGVIVWLFESASGGGPDEVRITLPIIAVLEPTSPCPHRPGTPTHRPIG